MATCRKKYTHKDIKKIYTQHFASMFDDIVLKSEQIQVVCDALNGCNCFVVLPTGFGKSMCFLLMPLLLKVVSNIWARIAIVNVNVKNKCTVIFGD